MPKSTKKVTFKSPLKICRAKTTEAAAAASAHGKAKSKELKRKNQEAALKVAAAAAAAKQKSKDETGEDAGEGITTPAEKIRRLSSPDSGQRQSVEAVMELKKRAAASNKSVRGFLRARKKSKRQQSSEDCS